jgi:hypothetical protein
MNRELDPATGKQLALIRDLGLNTPPNCTVARASDLIGLAQIIRHYAIFVARQEWHADINDLDLREVIRAVVEKPEIALEVQETMDAYTQAAWVSRDEQDKLPAVQKSAAEPHIFLDLREDENYSFVKAQLERFLPDIKALHPKRPLPPPPTPKVFLASDSGVFESVRVWLDGFLHR